MMYWRVRKYTPKEMLKRYGLHIGLIVSVLLNLLLFATRPNMNKVVSAEVKADFDAFVRRVTQHILDTSYITYEASTTALMRPDSGELAPPVVKFLQQQGQLPRDMTDLRNTAKSYAAKRRVSAVRIDEINQREMDNHNLIPVDVTGVVAVHSAEESYPGAVHFKFRFLVGFKPNTQIPIVANFQDLSPPAQ